MKILETGLFTLLLAAALLSSACQMGRGADRESGNWRNGSQSAPESPTGSRGAVDSTTGSDAR